MLVFVKLLITFSISMYIMSVKIVRKRGAERRKQVGILIKSHKSAFAVT